MLAAAIWSVPIATGLAYAPFFARSLLVAARGKLDNTQPRNEEQQIATMPKHLQELALRLKGSHLNQLEMLGLYAGAVAVGVAANVPPPTLQRLTSWYLKCRVAFNLAYAAPQVANGFLRSLSFMASLTSCFLIYAAAAKTAAESY